MANFANSYAVIEKADKNADGTLTVYGKATDDSLDIDQQICDPDWLKKAMPEWMMTGGNVREQHSSIAAGVATEYEEKSDGHYITALVVDPVSVKKVETGVLKGFSIGIKGPRVVRDTKAAGGRIVDGQIVEISLVDRPANPNAKLTLAKSIDGELVKYDDSQERDENGRWTSGAGSDSGAEGHDSSGSGAPGVSGNVNEFGMTPEQERTYAYEAAGEKLDEARSAIEELRSANASDVAEEIDRDRSIAISRIADRIEQAVGAHNDGDVRAASTHLSVAEKDLTSLENSINRSFTQEDLDFGFGNSLTSGISSARTAIEDYRLSLGAMKSQAPTPKDVARMVNKNADPAEEAAEPTEVEQVEKAAELLNISKSFLADLNKFDQATFDRARTELANLIVVEAKEMAEGHNEKDSIDHLLSAVKHLFNWYEGEVAEGEVPAPDAEILLSAEADAPAADGETCEKCGESMKMCKCADKAADDGDGEDAETANEDSTEKSVVFDEVATAAIIEKAVTQAKESVTEEIGSLKAALEAEQAKATQLADELATAKKAVASGGPKRAATSKPEIPVDTLLQKAAEYSVKAAATTDTVLAQGYRELAEEFTAKASRKDVTN